MSECRFSNPVYPNLCMYHLGLTGKDCAATLCDIGAAALEAALAEAQRAAKEQALQSAKVVARIGAERDALRDLRDEVCRVIEEGPQALRKAGIVERLWDHAQTDLRARLAALDAEEGG